MRILLDMDMNIKNLKKHWWRKNLSGLIYHDGRHLTDAEVRKVVEYGLQNGYEYLRDIPEERLKEIFE